MLHLNLLLASGDTSRLHVPPEASPGLLSLDKVFIQRQAGKMTVRKPSAAKPDALSSIPGSHLMEGEN